MEASPREHWQPLRASSLSVVQPRSWLPQPRSWPSWRRTSLIIRYKAVWLRPRMKDTHTHSVPCPSPVPSLPTSLSTPSHLLHPSLSPRPSHTFIPSSFPPPSSLSRSSSLVALPSSLLILCLLRRSSPAISVASLLRFLPSPCPHPSTLTPSSSNVFLTQRTPCFFLFRDRPC